MKETVNCNIANRENGLYRLVFVVDKFLAESPNCFSFINLFINEFADKKIIAANYYYPVLDEHKKIPLPIKSVFISIIHKIFGMAKCLYIVDIISSTMLEKYVDEIPHESIYCIASNNNLVELKRHLEVSLIDSGGDLLNKIYNTENLNLSDYAIFANDIGYVEVVGHEIGKERTIDLVRNFFKTRNVDLKIVIGE